MVKATILLVGVCSVPFKVICSIIFSCSVCGFDKIEITLSWSGKISTLSNFMRSITFACAPS